MCAFPKAILWPSAYSNPFVAFLSVISVSFILGGAGNLSVRDAI